MNVESVGINMSALTSIAELPTRVSRAVSLLSRPSALSSSLAEANHWLEDITYKVNLRPAMWQHMVCTP